MNISISRQVRIALAGLALAGACVTAHAAPVSFTVPLAVTQEVPPVQTSGSASVALTYDAATRVMTWNVTYSGLSSDATMAHLHGPAGAGKNAGVFVWLSEKGAPVMSPFKGQATLTPEQAQAFMAGQTYINVHTKDHPGGEIRGQVMPPSGGY